MTRVATCRDCGARFKVPDNVTAQKSKCSKCGGVVEIPAAGEGGDDAPAAPRPGGDKAPARGKAPVRAAPGRKPATAPVRAAARAAPATTAPGAGKAPVASKSRAGKPAASGRRADKGTRASAGRGRGGARSRRGGGGGGREGSSSALLWIVILVVVLGGGAAAWWFLGQGSDEASTDTTTGASTDGATTPAADDAVAADVGGTPVPDLEPDELDADATAPLPGEGAPEPATADVDAFAPPPPGTGEGDAAGTGEQAPLPASAPTTDEPDEPLPTVLDFEPLPPVLGTTQAQVEEWTALLEQFYFDPYLGNLQLKKLRPAIEELDGVDMIPAMFAVLDGKDVDEPNVIKGTSAMLSAWKEKTGGKPAFGFNGTVTERDVRDNNNRVKVLNNLLNYWRGQRLAGQDAEKLEDYRQTIAQAKAGLDQG